MLVFALLAGPAAAVADSEPSGALRVPVEFGMGAALSATSGLVTVPVLILSIYGCRNSVCAAGGLALTVAAFSFGAAGGVHLGNLAIDSGRRARFLYTSLGGFAGTSIAAAGLLTADVLEFNVFKHEWVVLSVIATMSSLGATLVFELDSRARTNSVAAPILQIGGSF
jgi:hypothetical protein